MKSAVFFSHFFLQFVFSLSAVLMTVPPAFAHEPNRCEALLQVPPAIAPTPMAEYSIEVPSAGRIYQFGQRVPSLKSGRYLFLITDRRELLLAPKYDVRHFLRDGRGLVTHKSLLKHYQSMRRSSTAPRIVAAGQLIITFGQVVRIENRSGNFRGGQDSLDFAVRALKRFGLVFTEDTKIKLHDPSQVENLGHTPDDRDFDSFQLEILKTLWTHPDGRRLLMLYEELGRLLVEISPRETAMDGVTLLTKNSIRLRRTEGLVEFTYPLSTSFGIDGLQFGIWRLIHRQPGAPTLLYFNVTAPYHLRLFARDGQIPMTESQNARLRALIAKFARVGRIYPL